MVVPIHFHLQACTKADRLCNWILATFHYRTSKTSYCIYWRVEGKFSPLALPNLLFGRFSSYGPRWPIVFLWVWVPRCSVFSKPLCGYWLRVSWTQLLVDRCRSSLWDIRIQCTVTIRNDTYSCANRRSDCQSCFLRSNSMSCRLSRSADGSFRLHPPSCLQFNGSFDWASSWSPLVSCCTVRSICRNPSFFTL